MLRQPSQLSQLTQGSEQPCHQSPRPAYFLGSGNFEEDEDDLRVPYGRGICQEKKPMKMLDLVHILKATV
jgi:hypothetical protein